MTFLRPSRRPRGFTSVELLLVIALSATVIGGAVISYGSIARNQSRVSAPITTPLGATRIQAFYGSSATTHDTVCAPSMGALGIAEQMRETFINDVAGGTAVFCLARDGANPYKPSLIAYDPLVHAELDTPQKFRAHLIAINAVAASVYADYRNPGISSSAVPPNVSVFILGYSKFSGFLKVNALYDIDVVRFTAAADPQGFHCSVKRYADPVGVTSPASLVYSQSYELFYPPSVPNYTPGSPGNSNGDWSRDNFSPLFVTFERATRMAWREGTATDRFKRAAERPFYFIWWPDPLARHLRHAPNNIGTIDPREAYTHMSGRTSFWFTVPMFPAL